MTRKRQRKSAQITLNWHCVLRSGWSMSPATHLRQIPIPCISFRNPVAGWGIHVYWSVWKQSGCCGGCPMCAWDGDCYRNLSRMRRWDHTSECLRVLTGALRSPLTVKYIPWRSDFQLNLVYGIIMSGAWRCASHGPWIMHFPGLGELTTLCHPWERRGGRCK